MKKLLVFSAILLAVGGSLQAAPTVTVTASAQSILGTTQTVSMKLTLIDPNQTGMLKAGSVVVTGFTATSANGTTVSVGPIYGNDVITDGLGNANTSYYTVQIFPVTNGIIASTPALQNFYAFIGSGTIDISTATPLSPSFQSGTNGNVVLPGNLTVTGSATFGSIVYNNVVSSAANPAQTGFVRMATGDFIAWRNNANLADLSLSKDVNDLLSWNGGSFKLTEVAAPGGVGNFDILYADSTAHRFKMNNNNGGVVQVVASGNDINTSDAVTALHFGATQEPLSGTAPTSGQLLQWNGTNIIGATSTAYLTSNFTQTGSTFINVTGLSFSVAANTKYKITCDLDYQVSANDMQVQWTGPASPTFVTYDSWAVISQNASNVTGKVATAFSTALALGTLSTGTNQPLRLTMTLSNGANAGTVQLQAASTGAGTVTIIPGSCSILQ